MSQIAPHINFNGTCREAMTFYQQCLGGELTLHPVAGSPMADMVPAEAANNIPHAVLVSGTSTLLGSDMMTGRIEQGNNMTVSVDCGSNLEINHLYAALAEGGHITHALKAEFWGATFGTLTDQFGTKWMFNHDTAQH